MFLSVVVPVYNVERYVGDCLCSLLNQPESLCEIIVVNDGTKEYINSLTDILMLEL